MEKFQGICEKRLKDWVWWEIIFHTQNDEWHVQCTTIYSFDVPDMPFMARLAASAIWASQWTWVSSEILRNDAANVIFVHLSLTLLIESNKVEV